MRYALVFSICLFSLGKCPGQASAKATVDSARLLIGDQLWLHLFVSLPAGAKLLPLDLEKLGGEGVEFLRQTEWDTLAGNGLRLRKDLVFTAWDSGQQVVPAVPIVFSSKGTPSGQNDRLDTLLTREIPVEVATLPDAPELADIKPIIEEPITWRDYLPQIVAGLVLLLAGLLIWLGLRMKTRQEALPPPPPPAPLSAQERALQQLQILRSEKRWQQGEVKAYHSRLTHIVREYLEGRFGVHALEKTTDEILAQMRHADLGPGLTEKMTALLQTADLVKFAKAEPADEYHERAMVMAEEFVRSAVDQSPPQGQAVPNPQSPITSHQSPDVEP